MEKDDINPFGGQPGFRKKPPKSQSKSTSQKHKDVQKLDGFEWINDEAGGICGEDVEYVEEEEMEELPHRHIGVVLAVHPMGVFQLGTGFLISRDLVLTCAHVTHSKAYMAEFESIYFYPAQYGELSNYIKVEDTATPEEYLTEEKWLFRKAYDYTLLKLKQKVDESGFLPLCGDLPQLDKNTTLTINGYPESKYDKKNKKPKAVKQYGLTRKGYILDVYSEASYMVHRISAEAGQSGAPVVKIEENGKMSVIGLHVGSPQEKSSKYQEEFPELKKANLAKLMNRLMVERLAVFAKRLGGEMFKILPVEHTPYHHIQEEKKLWEQEKQELLLKIKKMEEEKQELYSPEQPKKQKGTTKQGNDPKLSSKTKEEWKQEGNQHYDASRYAQALECYQKALTIDPNYKNAYNGIGNSLSGLGRKDEALASYEKALTIDSNDSYAHNGMGSTLYELGRKEEALASYRKALEIDPDYTDAHAGMGSALSDLGRNEEALSSYRKALEIDPSYKYAHAGMGLALDDLGRKEEALASYRKALVIDPNYNIAHAGMGNSLKHLGRFDEAVTSYHWAIQIDHNYQLPYNNLRLLLLNKGRTAARLTKSVCFLEGVLLQHPDSQPARKTVQILRAELKKFSE